MSNPTRSTALVAARKVPASTVIPPPFMIAARVHPWNDHGAVLPLHDVVWGPPSRGRAFILAEVPTPGIDRMFHGTHS